MKGKPQIQSAKERHEQPKWKDRTIVENNDMFCKFCHEKLNWKESRRLTEHYDRKDHKKYLTSEASKEEIKLEPNIQLSVPGMIHQKIHEDIQKNALRTQFVRILLSQDIPLYKLEAFKQFFEANPEAKFKDVKIPSESWARQAFLPALYQEAIFSIKKDLSNQKNIILLIDETSDTAKRCVTNVLCRTKEMKTPILLKTYFRQTCNAQVAAACLSDCLQIFNLSWNHILIIVSDSVNYMIAMVRNLKEAFAPQLLHIICNAHLFNLIASVVKDHPFFSDINELFSSLQYQFAHGTKKGRYLSFLEENGRPAKSFPKIHLIRWNSWFAAAFYCLDYLDDLRKFIKLQVDTSPKKEQTTHLQCANNLLNEDKKGIIEMKLAFLKENCYIIKKCMDIMEADEDGLVFSIEKHWTELKAFFKSKLAGNFAGLLTEKALNELKISIETEMIAEGEQSNSIAFLYSYEKDFKKVWQCIIEKIEFLIEKHEKMFLFFHFCSFFDPMNYVSFSSPPIDNIITPSSQAWNEASLYLKEGHVLFAQYNFKTIDEFWQFHQNQYPNLYQYYCFLKIIPCTNVSVERSFSMYKDFLKSKRMKLKEENAEMLYFLKVNKNL